MNKEIKITYNKFRLQPLPNHKFKVVYPIKIQDDIIPSGYTSDGASIPRIFWCLFPPNRTDYLPCAIIHDYYCDKEEYAKADECFEKCLKHLKVDIFSAKCLLYAVKIYHKIRYGV